MTIKNKKCNFDNIKLFIFESIKVNKFTVILTSVLTIIMFITGIIVASKTHGDFSQDGLGIIDIETGNLTSSFFMRLLSLIIIFCILFCCSFNIFLYPVAMIFLLYRTYLLGLYICLMIIKYGFIGTIISLFVVFPCQIFIMIIFIIFYVLLFKTNREYKCFGRSRYYHQKTKICLSTFILLLSLCVVESVLLLLLNAKIILII